jgi:peptidyl-prolyl cis-trans isomerase C
MTANTNGIKHVTGFSFPSLLKEPLLHFLVLTVLLFVVQALWGKDQRELIVVDAVTQDYLIQKRQEQVLRSLSDEEKQQVIDSYIEEELLVREARKHGYDNSLKVRSLLIQNMRFFYTSDQQNLSEDQLRAFYQSNLERFQRPALATYDYVFRKDVDAVTMDLLSRLSAGEDHSTLGDFTHVIRPRLSRLSANDLIKFLGAEHTKVILKIEDDQWHGPYTNTHGVHFVRVVERFPSTLASFESVRSWITQEWKLLEDRKLLSLELGKIREGYNIEIAKRTVADETTMASEGTE